MRKPLATLLISGFFFATFVYAQTPCDFKGVSVGNKMTLAEVMTAFGVTQYKMNPTLPSWEERQPVIEKYGAVAAGELED